MYLLGQWIIVFILLLIYSPAAAQQVMSVQVREAQLRTAPAHLAKIVAKAAWGDQVVVLEERGDWRRVSTAAKNQGWMHITALTSKRIALRADKGIVGTTVTRGEISLAGKGFSEEVEAGYRKENKNLDYASIDRMEAFHVSTEQIEAFIAGGRLMPEAGR